MFMCWKFCPFLILFLFQNATTESKVRLMLIYASVYPEKFEGDKSSKLMQVVTGYHILLSLYTAIYSFYWNKTTWLSSRTKNDVLLSFFSLIVWFVLCHCLAICIHEQIISDLTSCFMFFNLAFIHLTSYMSLGLEVLESKTIYILILIIHEFHLCLFDGSLARVSL